jgi:hypothetical protein
MRATTSIYFTKDGLSNPEAADFFLANRIETLVVFSDGSQEAYDHITRYDFSKLVRSPTQLAFARVPLWDLRMRGPDGAISQPNYVFSDQNRVDWLCRNICAPLIEISIFDVSKGDTTKTQMTRTQVELMCDMAYGFWGLLKVAESHLGFPAIVIDALTRETRSLSRQAMDIEQLRRETGLNTLDYNDNSDTLSVTIASEIFTVKLSVLDAFFKNYILPFFNKNLGRRYRLEVSIVGIMEQGRVAQQMSYGELGRQLEQMEGLIKQYRITATSPMRLEDLVLYSKKVSIHVESCLFGQREQAIHDLIQDAEKILVHPTEGSRPPVAANNDELDTEDTRVFA